MSAKKVCAKRLRQMKKSRAKWIFFAHLALGSGSPENLRRVLIPAGSDQSLPCPCGRIKFLIDVWNLQVQLIFQTLEFLSHFSQELWGLEDWNLVHTWAVGSCIMYTGIRLLLLIRPFISSFFFLKRPCGRAVSAPDFGSQVRIPLEARFFPNINGSSLHRAFHVHPSIVSKWLKYCWCKTLTHPSIHFSFSPIFNIHVLESECCCLFVPLFLHFLSLQFSNIKIFVSLLSGTVRPRGLKLGTQLDSGCMYAVVQNQAAAAYLSLYLFFSVSPKFK